MRPGTPRASGWWLSPASTSRLAVFAALCCLSCFKQPRSEAVRTDGRPADALVPRPPGDGPPPTVDHDPSVTGPVDGSPSMPIDARPPVTSEVETGVPTVTLTVTRTGEGKGQVESSDGAGISCGEDCSEPFERTTPPRTVRMDALAAVGSAFASWTGCDETQGTQCVVTLTADRTVTVSFRSQPVNRVFVTSTTYTLTDLSGTAIANAACTTRARAAGLPGNFLAWTDDNDALLNMSRGWVRTDGRPFKDALLSGNVYYPPSLDEFGQSVGEQPPAFSFVPDSLTTCRPGMPGGAGFPRAIQPGAPAAGTASTVTPAGRWPPAPDCSGCTACSGTTSAR